MTLEGNHQANDDQCLAEITCTIEPKTIPGCKMCKQLAKGEIKPAVDYVLEKESDGCAN